MLIDSTFLNRESWINSWIEKKKINKNKEEEEESLNVTFENVYKIRTLSNVPNVFVLAFSSSLALVGVVCLVLCAGFCCVAALCIFSLGSPLFFSFNEFDFQLKKKKKKKTKCYFFFLVGENSELAVLPHFILLLFNSSDSYNKLNN